jgi:hypothetical protein
LKQYTVEEADEEISGTSCHSSQARHEVLNSFVDWDGSEEEYGSSEPMDSLTELCTDLDPDAQL